MCIRGNTGYHERLKKKKKLLLGPDTWPKDPDTPQCAGKYQSPVNIQDWRAKYDPTLTSINFYNYNMTTNWNSTNNGHTGTKKSFSSLI